jgi:hypothetical protein
MKSISELPAAQGLKNAAAARGGGSIRNLHSVAEVVAEAVQALQSAVCGHYTLQQQQYCPKQKKKHVP